MKKRNSEYTRISSYDYNIATSIRHATEYSKIIYDMYAARHLIKISEETIDTSQIK